VLEILGGLLIIVVAVFVVRRLLGIDRGRWFITLAAVIAGEVAAGAILQSIYDDASDVPAVGWIGMWALVTVFAMLVVVLTELLTAPGAGPGRRGVPHPVRNTRELVRRARRYVEVGGSPSAEGSCAPGAAGARRWAGRAWAGPCARPSRTPVACS
jgi:hypothetical protein